MGSNESRFEGPQHEVTIAYAFEISKYEVTFDEYDAFAKATHRKLPDDMGWRRGRRPVIMVSFHDAQAYVQWLSQQTGKQYRLPTEAEWEYSARADTQTHYWWGDTIGNNNAVCIGCGSQWDDEQTAPVGSFKANAFGLYDTAGNVREWVQDCLHDNYKNAPTDGSAWLEANGGFCDKRVIRGGSWWKYLRSLQSTYRDWDFISTRGSDKGFRIARTL
jgi:formylglycine-generating enzyme required for sulfatase activity